MYTCAIPNEFMQLIKLLVWTNRLIFAAAYLQSLSAVVTLQERLHRVLLECIKGVGEGPAHLLQRHVVVALCNEALQLEASLLQTATSLSCCHCHVEQ
jgi:hypothetical protein